jgi:hypothetical protein
MKNGVVVLLMTGSLSCSQQAPVSEVSDPPEVELFGSGTISTNLPEFGTTFSPSGDTVFFNRTPPDRSRLDLLYAIKSGGVWTDGRVFEPVAGVRAIDPFLSADGTRLYFSSDLPRPGGQSGSFNLWYLARTPSGWSEPNLVPDPINSDSSDVFNSVAADGTMVFSSRRDGVRRIYSSRAEGGSWSDPTLLRFGKADSGSNPAISPDGQLIVFARPTSAGPTDLFVSCRSDAGWAEPQRLPEPVSSPFTELAPGFDDSHLYFTSERPGVTPAVPDSVRPPGDIYRTPRGWLAAMCPGQAA